jgi:hypothetical protein
MRHTCKPSARTGESIERETGRLPGLPLNDGTEERRTLDTYKEIAMTRKEIAERQTEIDEAYFYLVNVRKNTVYATVKSVSRSGMSRRIELYVVNDNKEIIRIGWHIAKILGYKYDANIGMQVNGCGMDMIFHVLSNFNYFAAQRDTGKTLTELLKTGECGTRIYDDYFFDASYRTL